MPIPYILLDDAGFGEVGMDGISVIRGYKTPNITAMAKEGLILQRMYTEPGALDEWRLTIESCLTFTGT